MLAELQIEGLALIADQTISFTTGLNVLSGASGAGKSLILLALKLLSGARTGRSPVGSGRKRATVRGLFQLSPSLAERLGLPDELVLERQVSAAGRSRCLRNGKLITRAQLCQLGASLLEIHEQEGSPLLRSPAHQTGLIDHLAGCSADAAQLRQRRSALDQQAQACREAREDAAASERLAAVWKDRLASIRSVAPRRGELLELETRLARIRQLARTQQALAGAVTLLERSDGACLEKLHKAERGLRGIAGFDAPLERLQSAWEEIRDVVAELEHAAERLSEDARECARLEERWRVLRRLAAPHRYDLEAVLAEADQLHEQLDEWQSRAQPEDLERELAKANATWQSDFEALQERRLAAARSRIPALHERLTTLGLEYGRLAVVAKDAGICWLFSANPGTEPRPLAEVGSGGELSRLVLAMREQLAAPEGGLLIFDEIDSPLGGRLGEQFGQCLRNVSRRHQIICVTHLPQVASFADLHLLVQKNQGKEKTVSRVFALDGAQRLAELAEMLRGSRATELTHCQVQELIDDARC